jgi:excisionase family DNA binding protein
MLTAMKAYLNASEFAKLLRVDRSTVSRWLQKGRIQGAIRGDRAGQWRIPLDSYDKLIKGNGKQQ